MTLPHRVPKARESICPACEATFSEHIVKAGRPATYCRRCRKDYKVYYGATRRQRERMKHRGWTAEKAYREAKREIANRLLGKLEDE